MELKVTLTIKFGDKPEVRNPKIKVTLANY